MKKTKRVECWAWVGVPSGLVIDCAAYERWLTKTELRDAADMGRGRVAHLVELPPGCVVVTREEARRPIASRLAVQNARLTAACATMETALELIADGEGDADALAQRALRATKARKK